VLDVIPPPPAVVEPVHARIALILAGVGLPDDTGRWSEVVLMRLNRCDVVAPGDLKLHGPVVIDLGGRDEAVLRIRIIGVQKRVAIGRVVRSELRLDVWDLDVPAHTHVRSGANLGQV
jgi:hypothetical protein